MSLPKEASVNHSADIAADLVQFPFGRQAHVVGNCDVTVVSDWLKQLYLHCIIVLAYFFIDE